LAKKLTYPGRDLEAMNFADNYHRWILNEFKPYVGKRVVEVGAGSGGFSEMLLELKPEVLGVIEPSDEMYPLLSKRLAGSPGIVRSYQGFFSQVADKVKAEVKPDTLVYVNVFEHIEDDAAELELINNSLTPGGSVLIFVPALPALYGPFDAKIGHFRRYTKRELVAKVRAAGFEVVFCRYFDIVGILPWWLKFRILGSDQIEPEAVKLYEVVVVPLMRLVESLIKPPIGKNLLIVARKK
jgi:SAM-dependent methyltransferase